MRVGDDTAYKILLGKTMGNTELDHKINIMRIGL